MRNIKIKLRVVYYVLEIFIIMKDNALGTHCDGRTAGTSFRDVCEAWISKALWHLNGQTCKFLELKGI